MLFAFVACDPPADATTTPEPARLRLTGSPSEQRVAQGAVTLFTMTIERQSFAGPVTLAADPSTIPTGVSVDFDPATLQPGITQAIARVSVAANAPVQYVAEPPLATIRVLAAGPELLRDTSSIRVRIVPSSLAGITLNATPADFTLLLGESGEGLVTLARQGNYTGSTAVQLIAVANMDLAPGNAIDHSITPVAGVPDTWRMRFSTANPDKLQDLIRMVQLIGGRLPFTVRATPQGLAPVDISVMVAVTMPTFAVTNGAARIEAGTQSTPPVSLFLQRSSRFTAPITMSIENAPPGITGTFSPNPALDDKTELTLRVAANVAPGTYEVDVLATPAANSGAAERRSRVAVTVTPTIPYRITVADLNVVAGSEATGAFNLTRLNGFAGTVSVGFTQILGIPLPAGMTVALTQGPLTQSAGTVRVTTTSATPPGTYSIQATGKTAGFQDVLQTFSVTVQAAPPPPPPPTSIVTRIAIEPRDAEVTAPATQQYSVALYNAAGARVQAETGGSIRYTSSLTTVARIDSVTGLATGANAGVTTITARYLLNGVLVQTDASPLTVYAAGAAGHYGSATISTNNNNTRTLRAGETLLFQLIVRNVAGTQVTSGVTPAPTVTTSTGNVSIAPCTPGVGPCPNFAGYFFTMTASPNATAGSTVRIRYDVMGAGGEITMTIVP
ncbi:MAG: hypothetical protein IBJ03_10235 [Gemmatimonadaceae bacterium]|nr:hypothetical protein [Gemmatimonadaceae bacterium]